ncbi:uracil-DNA glycosylase [Vibrio tapetis]|uniref:Uracil-DNA glycosylase n=1 Tax=Vibrio tapetis subsp. tapetis TaxID=1671868 RepID=A0A2N8ZFB7_9VIBR|nr:uracil-DNA glycosylase [Vibrio tapetis]SON50588.1 uracil-DNA-glycosylase [Vibrio tapetis subsp. tapetis]
MLAAKTWQDVISEQQQQEYFQQTLAFVKQERSSGKAVFPPEDEVFSAFDATPLNQVKVVILGQDPYHGVGQAHGLCFSVRPDIKTPPSLVNIYKELVQDIDGFCTPSHGYLQSWAKQGVLLLNTVLTVEQGHAHSHAKCGWETFTDKVIAELNERENKIIFLLWGAHAQKKGKMICRDKHLVLEAPHPSPLSAHRGFLGCGHFSKVNQYLDGMGHAKINWQPIL